MPKPMYSFEQCAACVKSDSQFLCGSCLHNREVITQLRNALMRDTKSPVYRMRISKGNLSHEITVPFPPFVDMVLTGIELGDLPESIQVKCFQWDIKERVFHITGYGEF